jgi:hypothetical protein
VASLGVVLDLAVGFGPEPVRHGPVLLGDLCEGLLCAEALDGRLWGNMGLAFALRYHTHEMHITHGYPADITDR